MERWKHRLTLLLLCLGSASLYSCLETVRRTDAGDAGKAKPWWAEGNSAAPADVKKDESTTAEPGLAASAPTSIDKSAVEKRSRSQETSTKRINEYAYWCIEQNMWDEARLHLERAVDQDSLSASLFNNLGVIYERLGLADRADSSYVRATTLQPLSGASQANLNRLRDRQELASRAFPDSVESSAQTAEAPEEDVTDGGGDDTPADN